jgi:hypothetical protein
MIHLWLGVSESAVREARQWRGHSRVSALPRLELVALKLKNAAAEISSARCAQGVKPGGILFCNLVDGCRQSPHEAHKPATPGVPRSGRQHVEPPGHVP